MGCWLSNCCGNSSDQNGEADETRHLLNDPVACIPSQRTPNDEEAVPYRVSVPKKPDEQSVMNKILHETATNVIDVAALGPHAMEQNEYLDRKEFYKNKLRPYFTTGWNTGRQPKCVLLDIPDPFQVASSSPISNSDYLLIDKMSTEISQALETLAVNHKEELIVPFQIP